LNGKSGLLKEKIKSIAFLPMVRKEGYSKTKAGERKESIFP
jgi:hypothetical protein